MREREREREEHEQKKRDRRKKYWKRQVFPISKVSEPSNDYLHFSSYTTWLCLVCLQPCYCVRVFARELRHNTLT
jgi:hypothetical protein